MGCRSWVVEHGGECKKWKVTAERGLAGGREEERRGCRNGRLERGGVGKV